MPYATCTPCNTPVVITFDPVSNDYYCPNCNTAYYDETKTKGIDPMTQDIHINLHDETTATIRTYKDTNGGNGKVYRLTWNNEFGYDTDEYQEFYQTLSLALARAATLSHAIETEEGFTNEPLRFSTNAIQFLKGETN